MKNKILICTDWFVPAFRAGGPIRSVENLSRLLSPDADIYIYTGDRDLNDATGYQDVALNEWIDYAAGVKVYYATPGNQTKENFKRILNTVNPSVLYVNSMFSKNFALVPVMVSRNMNGIKTVLAPRGMLRRSALAFKPLKKKLFLAYARLTGMFGHVHFHATDEQEVADIKKHIGKNSPVTLIGNVPAAPDDVVEYVEKHAGGAKIIYIGRIHPIKNLLLLLERLKDVNSRVECTLIGVMEDMVYWKRCEAVIRQLPPNISVSSPVEQTPAQLSATVRQHHLFVLPTQGENFGHAIFEAMCCARPVLISDQTPWRNLEQQHAGWDLPLSNPAVFSTAIEAVAAMDQQQWQNWCNGAHRLAQTVFNDTATKNNYLSLLS